MPANDRPGSAGDDGSMFGFMTGAATGHFADYARGDARVSYADRSIRGSQPAVRAERTALFVKQGPCPYVVIADDMQRSADENEYHWQWYSRAKSISGNGTFSEPFLIDGENAMCRLAFHTPASPEHDFRVVKGGSPRRPLELGLLRANLKGVRVRYLAVAAANRHGEPEPRYSRGPEPAGAAGAASITVEGKGFKDLIVWQPEETAGAGGRMITCGQMKTDALLAMVRINPAGKVLGYVLGDGGVLEYSGDVLARSTPGFSVIADASKAMVTGKRRARQNLPPLPAAGELRLPGPATRLWVDGVPVAARRDGLVSVGPKPGR
jgi:hypothetical protein